MKEKLFELLDQIDEECDLECHERIKDFLRGFGVEQVEVSVDEMFDSCGLDVYSVSVAWLENGRVRLAVGCIKLC